MAIGLPVPSFEDPAAPLTSPSGRAEPKGFGPIAPTWPMRARYAGTYDEAWKRERYPLAPHDFDRRHFNVAPLDQQLDSYRPSEELRLVNMTREGTARLRLPDLAVDVTAATADHLTEQTALVDTVVIDPERRQVSLVARAAVLVGRSPLLLRRIVVGPLTPGMRIALERGKAHRVLEQENGG